MCKRGQTVWYDGKEYRLTLKGRIYATWLGFIEWLKFCKRPNKP